MVQAPSIWLPSASILATSLARSSSQARPIGFTKKVPSGWRLVIWPARWSSYPSACSTRANSASSCRGVTSRVGKGLGLIDTVGDVTVFLLQGEQATGQRRCSFAAQGQTAAELYSNRKLPAINRRIAYDEHEN